MKKNKLNIPLYSFYILGFITIYYFYYNNIEIIDPKFNYKNNSLTFNYNNKINNFYEYNTSLSNGKLIYTKINSKDEMDVYVLEKNKTTQITNNKFIEFNPVINDKGDYAYALSEYSTSSSKVYLNNSLVTPIKSLFKNLAINDRYLIFSQDRLYDNLNFLWIHNIKTKSNNQIIIDGYIQKIKFLSGDRLIIQLFSEKTMSMDIYHFNIGLNELKKVLATEDDEIIKKIHMDNTFSVSKIGKDKKNIKLLFNSYYNYYNYQLANPFGYSNNFLGRLSWNQSYRIENLVNLYKLTKNTNIKTQLEGLLNSILSLNNENYDFDEKYNNKYSYATKKYSIDKLTPISMLVTDSKLYYSILLAIKVLDKDDHDKYKNIVTDRLNNIFDYYENNYDLEKKLYRFQYGMNFYLDGVYLPFNQQNSFGLVLLELYKLTNQIKYRDRVFELANKMKSEFIYQEGKIVWRYFPNEFYKGWAIHDGLSINMPERKMSEDFLFDDLSHAGISVKFILEFQKYFPEEIFTSRDISQLSETISGFTYDNKFSRHMGGDKEYEKESYKFIPSYGWSELNNSKLNNFYLNLNPLFLPDFDEQTWGKYLNVIDSSKFKSEILQVDDIKIDFNLNVINSNVSKFNYMNIYEYFEN